MNGGGRFGFGFGKKGKVHPEGISEGPKPGFMRRIFRKSNKVSPEPQQSEETQQSKEPQQSEETQQSVQDFPDCLRKYHRKNPELLARIIKNKLEKMKNYLYSEEIKKLFFPEGSERSTYIDRKYYELDIRRFSDIAYDGFPSWWFLLKENEDLLERFHTCLIRYEDFINKLKTNNSGDNLDIYLIPLFEFLEFIRYVMGDPEYIKKGLEEKLSIIENTLDEWSEGIMGGEDSVTGKILSDVEKGKRRREEISSMLEESPPLHAGEGLAIS